MIIVDSPFHVSFSSDRKLPSKACTGKCKKIWWESDYDETDDKGVCLQCGSSLSCAVKDVHFKVIYQANRNLRVKDFKPYKKMSNEEIEYMRDMIERGVKVKHISVVKSKFIEKAKREWC
ncbi:hypothetical protein [Microbulbifer sp. VAAF005]|uniref:hypothetical protein n=1 Tax=Microbulbifer sp. VAAF005 TaxID=3034230 RepID=UPI0024ADAB40|nr:hypothetical protein [Microbulbifer sp. VAAF005]WHI48963.1 hypothetical protein P0078_11605 [Microbulbifer sp. VAAF005]